MRFLQFGFLLAFALLFATPASAQPKGFITGNYKLTLTLDGTKYKMDVAAYQLSTTMLGADSVTILSVWMDRTAVQAAALPSVATLKGRQSSMTRIFKETAAGKYQKMKLDGVSIAGLIGSNTGPLTLQLRLPEMPAREEGCGIATGVLCPIKFAGPLLSLGGNDWD